MKRKLRVSANLAAVFLAALLLPWNAAAQEPSEPSGEVERGRYLAYKVTSCFICHGERDWSRYAGPLVPGREGAGNSIDYLEVDRYAPNITPAGLGEWSDEAILQVFAEGRKADGSPVHAFLEGNPYRFLTADDARALVAFLRTLEPIEQEAPPAPSEGVPEAPEPSAPAPADPAAPADTADTVAHGGYLVRIGSCRFCHGPDLSGGKTFQLPNRDPISPVNLTPAAGTVTGGRSREEFIGRFKAFASDGARRLRAPEPASSTVMPWTDLARMSDDDLGAIYDYLKTLDPVSK